MLGILRIPEILLETHVRPDISARKCPASREYHVEIHASFPPSVIPGYGYLRHIKPCHGYNSALIKALSRARRGLEWTALKMARLRCQTHGKNETAGPLFLSLINKAEEIIVITNWSIVNCFIDLWMINLFMSLLYYNYVKCVLIHIWYVALTKNYALPKTINNSRSIHRTQINSASFEFGESKSTASRNTSRKISCPVRFGRNKRRFFSFLGIIHFCLMAFQSGCDKWMRNGFSRIRPVSKDA